MYFLFTKKYTYDIYINKLYNNIKKIGGLDEIGIKIILGQNLK